MQRKYILQAESLINDFHFGWKFHPKINHAPPMPKHSKPTAVGYFSGSKTTIASSKCPKTEASLIKKIFHLPSLDIALNNTSQQVKNMTFPKHAYFSSLFWSYFYDFYLFRSPCIWPPVVHLTRLCKIVIFGLSGQNRPLAYYVPQRAPIDLPYSAFYSSWSQL